VWPPPLAHGLSPPALPASGLRPGSRPSALGCRLPSLSKSPQPEQVAPQQACSPVLGRVLSTNLVASGPFQPGEILEGDPGRLSPGLLPANKPVNKAP